MTLRVSTGMLPADRHARHGRLRDYFCDKDAVATWDPEGWRLHLEWPGAVDRHVDPRLRDGLDQAWGGIALNGMAVARRRSGRVLTALYDTWTLASWSHWLARGDASSDGVLTILHVDDHRDLGSPRLHLAEGDIVDLITGERFDLLTPSSVEAAILSGAVGMGSFLTPILHALPTVEVRQLGQGPKVEGTRDFAIAPGHTPDDLLQPGAARPSIDLLPGDGVGPGRYRITDDLEDWLAGIRPGPVLLHIDMDYFNNRYDGDGDWPDNRHRHDPPLGRVLDRIDELTGALRRSGVLPRVADAVVAFSPGFFPAEMWLQAEARLTAGLAELHV